MNLPNNWKYLPLSEVCEINPKKSEIKNLPDEELVSFLTMADVSEDGEILNQKTRLLHEVIKNFTYFRKDDVLFAKITPCMENGKGAIAKIEQPIGFGSTEFHVLRPKEGILSEWISLFLSQKRVRKIAEKSMTGSAGQKRVPTTFFQTIKIPLPPLNVQKKIVASLEKTEQLKQCREETDKMTTDYLESVFLDMFGDPVKNPKKWPKEELNQNVQRICVSYVGPCNKHYTSKENGIPMIRTGNLKRNYVDWKNLKYVTKEFHEKQKKSQLKEGDLLIARHGTNGQTSRVTKDIGNANSLNVVILRPNKDIYDPIFLTYCFNNKSNLSYLGNNMAGSTQNVINTRAIQNHKLIKPNLKQQKEFASIVQKVEIIMEWQNQSKNHIDVFFNALMKKAFRGELVC